MNVLMNETFSASHSIGNVVSTDSAITLPLGDDYVI